MKLPKGKVLLKCIRCPYTHPIEGQLKPFKNWRCPECQGKLIVLHSKNLKGQSHAR